MEHIGTKYLTWSPHGDIAVTRALLRAWEEESRRPDVYHWAIVLREGGVLIGDISIAHADAYQETGSVGYCMGKTWWGRGLMTTPPRIWAPAASWKSAAFVRRACAVAPFASCSPESVWTSWREAS